MKIKELTILFLIILAVLKVRASITQEQKDALINFYKQNRANYNDDKININELYWDDQRAKYAEYNTNICPNKNQTSIINNYNETELFNQIVSQKDSNGEPNYKAKFIGSMTGGKNIDNSTQIITKMGCVLVNCNFDNVDFRFMECNYKTGNITGQETYALVPKTPAFGLTQEQKDILLNLHRQARAEVNNPNMKELNWNDELANIAQDYANKCLSGHSDTGPENIAGGTWITVTGLFNLFMKEKKAYEERTSGKTYGHYILIINEYITNLGCGLAYCSGYEAHLVCRYEDYSFIGSEVYSLKNTTIAISTTSTIEPIITTITNTTSTIKPTATTNTTTTTITTTTTSTATTTTTTNDIKPKITTSTTTTSTIKPKTITTTKNPTTKNPTTKKTTTKKTTTKKTITKNPTTKNSTTKKTTTKNPTIKKTTTKKTSTKKTTIKKN